MSETATMEPLKRFTRDIKDAAAKLGVKEARFLVDTYYQMQEARKRSSLQILTITFDDFKKREVYEDFRELEKKLHKEDGLAPQTAQKRAIEELRDMSSEEPHRMLDWLLQNSGMLERNIKSALGVYAGASPLGAWAMRQKGIGPICASGLLAHVDLKEAKAAGSIWRFAGLDPSQKWEKGKKRPWNARLKVICYHLGEGFVKVSNKEDAFYGKLFRERKAFEVERNEKGNYKDAAKEGAERVGKQTEAYKSYKIGKLPKAHVHAIARRWVVKLFLSHYFEMGHRLVLKKDAPNPYVFEHLGHVGRIEPPE